MRPTRLALAVVLLVAAVFAALLAADVRSWREGVSTGDARFVDDPASASWTASTVLPSDPAKKILNLSSQLGFRLAAQSFVSVEAAGNGYDNGYSESRDRAALETVLTDLARGPNRTRDSQAENLLGILAFSDSQQRGPVQPAPVERSVADFQAAAQLDPGDEDAKFNLEWLLRALIAKGSRPGSTGGNGGPAKGHQGAGGGLPGKGY